MEERREGFIHRINQLMQASQKALELLLVILTVIMVILVFFQVIFRYVFFHSLSWSEEFSTFVFVWIVLLGSAVGIRRREHLGIDSLVKYFPQQARRILETVAHLVIMLFFFVVLYSGWEVAMANMARRANTADIPMGYVRMALPIMALFALLFEIEIETKLIRTLVGRKSRNSGEETSGRTGQDVA